MFKRGKTIRIFFIVAVMAMMLLFGSTAVMAEETVDDSVYLNHISVTAERTQTEIGLRVPVKVTLYKSDISSGPIEIDFLVEDIPVGMSKGWDVYNSAIGGSPIEIKQGTFSIVIPAGEESTTVYFTPRDAGQYRLSAARFNPDGNEIKGSVDLTATLLPGKILEIGADANSIYAGDRVGVDIHLYDQFENNPAYTGPITVNLDTDSPEGKFYASADPSDSTPIQTVKLTRQEDGSVMGRVFYSDTRAYTRNDLEDSRIFVTYAKLDPATKGISVEPLGPAKIDLQAEGQVFQLGDLRESPYSDQYYDIDRLNRIELQYLDKYGNPTDVGEFEQYFSVSSSDNGLFYQDGEQVTQVRIDWWDDYFYFVPTAAPGETVTIRVSGENTGFSANIDVSVQEFQGMPIRELHSGWNTLSFPIQLADMSLKHILGPERGNVEAIYGYVNGEFTQITDLSIQLKPLDAIFVKVKEGKRVRIFFDFEDILTTITPPPSKQLNAGWNFVGPAFVYDEYMPVNENFVSIGDKYSQVVFPGYDYEGYKIAKRARGMYPWTYVAGQKYEDEYDVPNVGIFAGYWVFMREAGTLAGFSVTPLPIEPMDK